MAEAQGSKVFWFFFSKKNCFLHLGQGVGFRQPLQYAISIGMEQDVANPLSDRARLLVELLCRFDGLKRVERSDYVGGTGRRENAAEHSWHAMLVLMMYRHLSGDESLDYAKAYELLIIHDLPEIVAGDTPVFGGQDNETVAAREREGLSALLGNHDPAFGRIISGLWEEFEALETPEARVAKASDRFQGCLQNLSSGGRALREREVTREQLESIMRPTREHGPFFAALLEAMLRAAAAGGYLPQGAVQPDAPLE